MLDPTTASNSSAGLTDTPAEAAARPDGYARRVRGERARIRGEMLLAFRRMDRLALQWDRSGLAEPVLSIKLPQLLAALDEICPEEE